MTELISRRKIMIGAVTSLTALACRADGARKPKTHVVKIRSFTFEPAHLQVQSGDSVRWINEDLAPHTATAEEFGWDTGELANGASAEVEVSDGMETTYFCAFHPHMKGSFEII
ncbi:cupredoxin domain-containing protein [Ruegeria hyattellae]|uniref:cupredoxin domain-containing protein n=1 Tax=Ruegeria hyattellae TaxID=3233337 RepID=UPI00355B3BA9